MRERKVCDSQDRGRELMVKMRSITKLPQEVNARKPYRQLNKPPVSELKGSRFFF